MYGVGQSRGAERWNKNSSRQLILSRRAQVRHRLVPGDVLLRDECARVGSDAWTMAVPPAGPKGSAAQSVGAAYQL